MGDPRLRRQDACQRDRARVLSSPPRIENAVDFQTEIVMQARRLHASERQNAGVSDGLTGLVPRRRSSFQSPAWLGERASNFLTTGLSDRFWNRKPAPMLKFQFRSSRGGRQSCSRWRPVRSTPCRAGPSGDIRAEWDGFRCLLIRSGDRIRMQSKSGRPCPLFSRSSDGAKRIGETQFTLDGEFVIAVGERFSFDDHVYSAFIQRQAAS